MSGQPAVSKRSCFLCFWFSLLIKSSSRTARASYKISENTVFALALYLCVCVCMSTGECSSPYQEDLYAFDFWSCSGCGADTVTSSPLSSNKTVLSAPTISLSHCWFLSLQYASPLSCANPSFSSPSLVHPFFIFNSNSFEMQYSYYEYFFHLM